MLVVGLAVVASCTRQSDGASNVTASTDRSARVTSSTEPTGDDPGTRGPPDSSPGGTNTSTTVEHTEGSSREPITLPRTSTSLSTGVKGDVERTAAAFLGLYWSTANWTYRDLAEAMTPYATERFLHDYREPPHSTEPINGGQRRPVDEIATRATDVATDKATVSGTGVATDPALGPRVLKRTLTLVHGPDGTWRVDAIQ